MNKVKLSSQASQENFEEIAFFRTKYEQMTKLEHLICPKGGDTNPLVVPSLLKVQGHVPPLPPNPTPLRKFCHLNLSRLHELYYTICS